LYSAIKSEDTEAVDKKDKKVTPSVTAQGDTNISDATVDDDDKLSKQCAL